jgi:hypothetical protein
MSPRLKQIKMKHSQLKSTEYYIHILIKLVLLLFLEIQINF